MKILLYTSMVKYFHFHYLRTGESFDEVLRGVQCQHQINGVQCRNRWVIGISTCWVQLLSNQNAGKADALPLTCN
jgi:hypothetical protein